MKINKIFKAFLAFIITVSIFVTVIYLSNFFTTKKIESVQEMEDKMFTDILSLETQFDLLEDLICEDISEKSILSDQIPGIARKLSFMESHLGSDNEKVKKLKRRYSLLQIKDLILMKKIAKKCELKPIFILYFYSNDKKECNSCKKQGYVLQELLSRHENLRVYSFDLDLNLSLVNTLLKIHNVKNKFQIPILIIENKVLNGFQDIEDILDNMPKLKEEEDEIMLKSEEIVLDKNNLIKDTKNIIKNEN